MSYGLQVRDNSGNVILSVTERITRLLYYGYAYAGQNGEVTISGISGIGTVQFAIPVDSNKCPHTVYKDGNTIKWEAQSEIFFPSGNCIIFVFAYT